MRQYVTLKEEHASAAERADMAAVCRWLGAEGTEVFMDDICPRDKMLFTSPEEKDALAARLRALDVRRVHCAYWAWPTALLTKNRFSKLAERFGGEKAVRDYYGDLTGGHMFRRWMQEYEIASVLNAQCYNFHLIDYAPIDGLWPFSISRSDIRQAMVYMIQHLVNLLLDAGLMTAETPRIELENAGFGLEYGMQTAEDFAMLFGQLYDPMDRVCIGWDINHLLHALGKDQKTGRARFFLPPCERTPVMEALEEMYGGDPARLAAEWLRHNLLYPAVAGRVGAVQLSDCALKTEEYFTNGRLNEPWAGEIDALKDWESREEYGVGIVLSEYDSHVILGEGVLRPASVRDLLARVEQAAPGAVLLHELKNSPLMSIAVERQQAALKKGE